MSKAIPTLADLAKEYRPSMDREVLHSWAEDVVAALSAALENENAELRQMATRVAADAKLTDVFGNGAKHYIVTPYLLDALRSALGDGGGE